MIEVNDSTFEREVLQSNIPVLVDFWAPWCGPCRSLMPHIEALSRAYSGRVKIVKVNVDQSKGTARTYGVQAIPALHLFVNGESASKLLGAVPKAKIEAMLNTVITAAPMSGHHHHHHHHNNNNPTIDDGLVRRKSK